MRAFYLFVILILVLCFGLALWLCGDQNLNVVLAYQEFMRTPLFTAFVTIASFMLALKTFMLLRLKELYDAPAYKDIYLKNQSLNHSLSYYGPLVRMGNAVSLSVGAALATSISQMTLGFVQNRWAIAACLSIATTTMLLVLFCWWLLTRNLRDWFTYIETDKQDILKKEAKQAQVEENAENSVELPLKPGS